MEISRKDIVLDDKKFSGLIGSGLNSRHSLAEIFSGICLYLEESGEIVAEFNPPQGTLHYVTFRLGDWAPSETAPARIVRAHENAMRKSDSCGVVYDIFTGRRICSDRSGGNLGDLLRAAVDDF